MGKPVKWFLLVESYVSNSFIYNPINYARPHQIVLHSIRTSNLAYSTGCQILHESIYKFQFVVCERVSIS